MDVVILNGKLVMVDYLKLKEFIVKKNKGAFLKAISSEENSLYKEVASKINYYSALKNKYCPHPYLSCYSSTYFVDYRDVNAVANLEKEADKKYKQYKECEPNDSLFIYFLNPILYKKSLSRLDKIGAILYFTAGVKCAAWFNKYPHIKKYIPSNGARYPFKPFLFVNSNDVGSLEMGVYEYDMRSHALVKHTKDFQLQGTKNALSIMYFADVTRVMNRYPNAIFYRDLLFDYGHLLATLRECVSHYKMANFLSIIDCETDAISMDKKKQFLELPFVQVDFEQSFFS